MHGATCTRRRWAALVVLWVLTAACADSAPSSAPVSTTPITAPATRTRLRDGRLRIGVLLPLSGTGATFGAPLVEGVQLAAAEINAAGGVNARPVELITQDVGSDTSTAAGAVRKLLASDVDAIVGPASSNIALNVLGSIVEAGVVSCSPTAAAISLTQFPTHGLFFRTIPSDAVQAAAMADVIDQSGRRSTAVFYPNDDYGKAFFQQLNAALVGHGIDVTPAPFDPASADLSSVVVAALGANPAVLAIVSDSAGGTRVLAALRLLTANQPSLIRPIVVNDPLRRADIAGTIGTTAPLLSQIKGTSPDSAPASEAFSKDFAAKFPGLPSTYAAYAYDCTNLLAIASQAARSDDPAAIAAAVADVSRNGTHCATYKECAALLGQNRNIDYDGASGSVDLNSHGDVTSGRFEQFGFDGTGRDVTLSEFAVNAGT